MAATTTSKRGVFRTIAEHPNYHWPYFRIPDTEYTAADLDALEHDIHRLASVWFRHDAHEDVEAFICWCPLHHLDFSPYDAHPAWHAQSKPIVPMVRALMLMNLHGWEHETAFVAYLDERPDLVDALGFDEILIDALARTPRAIQRRSLGRDRGVCSEHPGARWSKPCFCTAAKDRQHG